MSDSDEDMPEKLVAGDDDDDDDDDEDEEEGSEDEEEEEDEPEKMKEPPFLVNGSSQGVSSSSGGGTPVVVEKHPEVELEEGYDDLPPPEPTAPKPAAAGTKIPYPAGHDEDPSENVIEEGDEDNASAYEGNPPEKKEVPEIVVDEEDEEVRIAMEMALAAMKNPHLSPEEIRKKVLSEQSPQSEFIKQVEEKKQKKLAKEREEAQKRWNEQKEYATSWFTWGTAALSKVSEEYEWTQAKIKYADKIKADKKVQNIRRAIKARKKSLKAVRLQGNRVETRHIFKRQRMEKHMIEVNDAIEKYRHTFCETNYNVTAYAKAMMKASKKWNKPTGTDQELALESQLCRNMHQMLALEKQKSKLKKSLKEIKKYLQRCKSWLSDKQALCELHSLTLEATQASMLNIYQDTLARQDALIATILKENKESLGGDDSPQKLVAAAPVELRQKYDSIPRNAGPGATLNALRGLPFKDSIYLKSGSLDEHKDEDEKQDQQQNKVVVDGVPSERQELVVNLADDSASINSALTDPDADDLGMTPTTDADSVSGNIAFGEDAPWLGDDEELGGEKNGDPAAVDPKEEAKKRELKKLKQANNKVGAAKEQEEAAKNEQKKSTSTKVEQLQEEPKNTSSSKEKQLQEEPKNAGSTKEEQVQEESKKSTSTKDEPKKSTGDKERSSSTKDRSGSDKERSSSTKDRSSSTKDRSSSDKDRSSSDKDRSSSDKERSSSEKERSSGDKERSSSNKERSSSNKDRSSSDKDRSSTDKDRSSTDKERGHHKDRSSTREANGSSKPRSSPRESSRNKDKVDGKDMAKAVAPVAD